ncbi:unnamed protein product [Meganyctiphanes norvegica]|uniref:Uncharacterized protein n=1 Tax=Meganyctiphanes norvegica TaxID=48144 RepID=A0AAV2SF10_MEGNR
MKIAIFFLLAAVAFARPTPEEYEEQVSVELLHHNVVHPDEEGAHSVDFAADNGISFQLSGSEGEDGGANMVGSYTYIVEGEAVPLTFVANEYGFQPQSSLLPVAPAFPHEIPEWVLEQIAFAEQERAAQAYEEES